MTNTNKGKKVFIIPLMIILLSGFLLAGAVGILIGIIPVSIPVTEAIATSEVLVTFTNIPADSLPHSQLISITNLASVPLNAQLTWNQISNENSVLYVTDLPKTISILSGTNNYNIDIVIPIGEVEPTGEIKGKVIITRVA
jgi:hypothetical protein